MASTIVADIILKNYDVAEALSDFIDEFTPYDSYLNDHERGYWLNVQGFESTERVEKFVNLLETFMGGFDGD